ncbi:hypothetical protein FV139_12930 [Parahaliea maris]|uniref:Uncharacterized protein n=1 Tax=Parahaliea maris TaxID=2716870 RepID=A0A5C8ZWC5_9GAMM|nr:hypothetical protein [Parahaliea maris]TXS92865.1 hypothetical protein FV139_12930 [Parahaliea maris]
MPQPTRLAFHYELLGQLGLPPASELLDDHGAVPCAGLEDSVGATSPPAMLYELQCSSARRHSDWLAMEYSMQRLLEQLGGVPPYGRSVDQGVAPVRSARNEAWWLELGPVDFDDDVITLEREGYMLGALAATEEGRLRLTAYRPLDARSLSLLVELAAHPHPRLGVAMRETNWLLAVDKAAELDHFLAAEQGEAYLAHWPGGLGESGGAEAPWQAPLAAMLVEVQLQVFQHFSALAAGEGDAAS